MTLARLARILGLASAMAVALVACGASATSSPGRTSSPSGASAPGATAIEPTPSLAPSSADVPSSPVDGVVTKVDSSGLADVKALTLRTQDGRILDIRIGTLENGAEFPPGHLTEHIGTSEPVRVYFRVEGSSLVAYRLEDASNAPSSS